MQGYDREAALRYISKKVDPSAHKAFSPREVESLLRKAQELDLKYMEEAGVLVDGVAGDSFYDDDEWWLTCEPNYTVYLADEDRQTWNEVWLPAGQSTVLTGILSIPDGAGELTMEYSSHSYSTERKRDTISLPG